MLGIGSRAVTGRSGQKKDDRKALHLLQANERKFPHLRKEYSYPNIPKYMEKGNGNNPRYFPKNPLGLHIPVGQNYVGICLDPRGEEAGDIIKQGSYFGTDLAGLHQKIKSAHAVYMLCITPNT